MGRFRARPRPNGYDIDVKAPDGFLLGGWRRVTKAGYIRFAGSKWTHPDMRGHAGEYAFVHVDCHMGTEASFTFDNRQIWASPWNGQQWKDGRKPMDTLP